MNEGYVINGSLKGQYKATQCNFIQCVKETPVITDISSVLLPDDDSIPLELETYAFNQKEKHWELEIHEGEL